MKNLRILDKIINSLDQIVIILRNLDSRIEKIENDSKNR